MVDFDWETFLTQFSKVLLQDAAIASQLPATVLASGWLGYPGATDAQITRAEVRLGAALPFSYRSFLKVTNGWRQTGPFINRLWSTEEIEWYPVRHQDLIDAGIQITQTLYPDLPAVSDEEYFVYGDDQNPAALREEYLQTALEISDLGDSAIYLLNPQIVTREGEWEAWFLASWRAGADRYRSFVEMMQAEYESYLQLREDQ